MPNWCSNQLKVSGPERDVQEFKAQAQRAINSQGQGFDLMLASFFPTPPEMIQDGSSDWYQWRLQNWGVKWDIEGGLVSDFPDALIYDFSSPWSEPAEAIRKISEMFPRLDFCLEYEEPGNNSSGEWSFSNGEASGGDDQNFTDRFYMCEDEDEDEG